MSPDLSSITAGRKRPPDLLQNPEIFPDNSWDFLADSELVFWILSPRCLADLDRSSPKQPRRAVGGAHVCVLLLTPTRYTRTLLKTHHSNG